MTKGVNRRAQTAKIFRVEIKVKAMQSRYRPRGLQEVKVPRFHDNGTE
jgi:hypothetical protein